MTVKKSNENKIGAIMVVGSFLGISGQKKKHKENESLCRVKFSVPILLPSEFYDWSKELNK